MWLRPSKRLGKTGWFTRFQMSKQTSPKTAFSWSRKWSKNYNSCGFSGITALVWFYLLLSPSLACATPFSPSEDKARFCHPDYSEGRHEKEKERKIAHFLCLIRSDKLTVVPAIKKTATQCVLCSGSVTFLSHSIQKEQTVPWLRDGCIEAISKLHGRLMPCCHLRSSPPETSRRQDMIED